jgi:hypothetical protein
MMVGFVLSFGVLRPVHLYFWGGTVWLAGFNCWCPLVSVEVGVACICMHAGLLLLDHRCDMAKSSMRRIRMLKNVFESIL